MENLANWVIKKGLDKVDVSMFDEKIRKEVLTEVGERFIRMEKRGEAIKALILASNVERLVSYGKELMELCDFGNAFLALEPTANREQLVLLGTTCLGEGFYELAFGCFKAGGDHELARFVEDNYMK